ncbi:MAG: hypothetical protein KAQ75_08810 [Bacteroidales bacterium]|nr:hypothetical protein [Bacteroidales bacterium]
MKKLNLFLVILFFSASAFSQDYIYLKDNSIIEAVVQEVNINMVKYTKYSDPEGEVFAISPNALIKIVFSNGYVREFSGGSSPKKASSSEKDSYFALGAGFGRSYGGIGIRAQARFGKKQGFGLHAGVGYNPEDQGGGGVGFGLGAKFFYYQWLYINVQAGIVSYDYYYDGDYDDYVNHSLFGYSILFGGDFFFGDHIGLNVAIGPTLISNAGEYNSSLAMGIDLGFIFKF